MGIEDIQISEELETNAPSIKYSGNEGPKSPQEMEMMMMPMKIWFLYGVQKTKKKPWIELLIMTLLKMNRVKIPSLITIL